jgi:hypothetical protein
VNFGSAEDSMDKENLSRYLRREVDRWSAKTYQILKVELSDVVSYSVDKGTEFYQVEVHLLESEPAYLHVAVAVDDGLWRAFLPLSTSFLVYSDGRAEKPEFGG